MPARGRVVYASGTGRICPGCGWPAADCRCAATLAAGRAPVPDKVTAKLRIESRGSGKQVTVVFGLPANSTYLESLCRDLKKMCGTGGSVGDESVELQGDQRERLREVLAKRGMVVKG